MSRETVDHHDAELVIKLYDLRRETVMRQSRDAMTMKFWPKSYEEFIAVTQPAHPMNAAFRQASSYWEMAYGFAKHGAVNADLLIESGGEGLFLYAKILPYLERFRKEASPTAFTNCEWISTQCVAGRMKLEMIKARVKQIQETQK